MTSPRDPIEHWLETEVAPLSPPPGSLARIRQQARRRKTRQATFAAAGCAVVLAGAVAAPQVISALHQPGQRGEHPIAVGSTAPSLQPSRSSNTPAPLATKHTPIQTRQHTRLSASTSGTLPPRNFQPTSVTFVGNTKGGVVGAVIGQAGSPGHCATQFCTSLAGTSTYGHRWYGVSAPLASGPSESGSSGVSQLRFANLSDGWAYGPALEETSDGGWPWHRIDIGDQRVIDLESAPARAFAVFGTCNGTGSAYAASCSSYSLWTSLPGSRTWTPVSVPAAYQPMQSTSSAAPQLVISGDGTGYLLTPSGEVLSGPASDAGGAWTAVGTAKCKPGSPAANGQAAQPVTQLAAGPTLVLACDTPTTGARFSAVIYTSADGASWRSAGSVTVKGTPTSLSFASPLTGPGSVMVLATTDGIRYSTDRGKNWHAAAVTGGSPDGGFRYVGMTTASQGVAVPVSSSLGEIYVTTDGGKTWQPSPITG